MRDWNKKENAAGYARALACGLRRTRAREGACVPSREFRVLFAFLPAILLLTGSVLAQPSDLRDARYGTDLWGESEGLPQSRIRAIEQTRDGYLWLGTDQGLVRFNGASFTAFTVETGSLLENEISSLQEDDEGGLWIGTYGGGVSVLRNGRFTSFTKAEGLPDDAVNRLGKDREGNIWIITSGGACRYSRGRFTTFTTRDGLSSNAVTALCAESS